MFEVLSETQISLSSVPATKNPMLNQFSRKRPEIGMLLELLLEIVHTTLPHTANQSISVLYAIGSYTCNTLGSE